MRIDAGEMTKARGGDGGTNSWTRHKSTPEKRRRLGMGIEALTARSGDY